MTEAMARPGVWATIVQRALLGTERAGTSAALTADGPLGMLLSRIEAPDAEHALLSAAALAGTHEAAGRLPTRTSAKRAPPATPESEDLQPAPARVARFLATMLGGVNAEVLPEWLAVVASRRWRVPTPLLPALLDAGQRDPAYWDAITSVLGGRGQWLASQNPDWRYAVIHELPADEEALRAAWETGTREERVAMLGRIRARDRTLGRKLVESTWKEDHPSTRMTFLAVMSEALGPDDELLLERALDDRRQEVRMFAAEVLRVLPGSALLARMTARAQAALTWKPGKLRARGEIIVAPPAELDDALARDGVWEKPPPGTGERAWWLAQIIGSVPPATWSARWNVTPEVLIAAAAEGDWGLALTDGWAAAAVRNRDAAWVEALLASGFPRDKPSSLVPDLDKMLRVLPIDRRQALIATMIKSEPSADILVGLISAAEHPWGDAFGRLVLAWVRKRVAASVKDGGRGDWQLREIIPRLALRLPPTLAKATDDWPAGEDAAGWSRALERFITTLTFRRELHEELER